MTAEAPLFRVVHGNPSGEETAALAVVLAAKLARPRGGTRAREARCGKPLGGPGAVDARSPDARSRRLAQVQPAAVKRGWAVMIMEMWPLGIGASDPKPPRRSPLPPIHAGHNS